MGRRLSAGVVLRAKPCEVVTFYGRGVVGLAVIYCQMQSYNAVAVVSGAIGVGRCAG